MPTTIKEALWESELVLQDAGIADPRREAISILAAAIKQDRTYVYTYPERLLSSQDDRTLNDYLTRRSRHEPFQYIVGVQEFYGLEFEVTPDVLIPRPETEMIVEHAIKLLGDVSEPRFCEVGVGSGCINVSILKNIQTSKAVGLDISPAAMAVAERNAQRHGVIERLKLLESDVFSLLADDTFDLIVSNPPYVPSVDLCGLQPEVRDFEPHSALFAGADGLDVIRRLVSDAPRFLRPDGSILIEIGIDQSGRVAELFDRTIWHLPEVFPDLQGIPRLVHGRRI